jgi:hypothetical protein
VKNEKGRKLNVEPNIFIFFHVSQFVACGILFLGHRQLLQNMKNQRKKGENDNLNPFEGS